MPDPDGEDKRMDWFAELLSQWVPLSSPEQRPLVGPQDRKAARRRADILERTLELWRIRNRCIENELTMEEFLSGSVKGKDGRVVFCRGQVQRDGGSGTPPIRLQTPLLLYLLFCHSRPPYILDIIRGFIEKVWDHLEAVDFKRTQTGVLRCYTNTRFAANALRDYGLLKFTRREAYKTWVLSLPGFVVASKLMGEEYKWLLPREERCSGVVLATAVQRAWDEVKDFDAFVVRLAAVCRPDVAVFKTFNDVLREAYKLLDKYWAVIGSRATKLAERRQVSAGYMRQLDNLQGIDEFYREFSASLNIQRLLAQLE